MIDTLTRVYALLVCFVCMVCMTVTTGLGIYELVKVVNPLVTLGGYRYENLVSDGSHGRGHYPAVPIDGSDVISRSPDVYRRDMSDQQAEELRQRKLAGLIRIERHNAISSLVRIAIVLLVTAPVFFIHWRISQRVMTTPH